MPPRCSFVDARAYFFLSYITPYYPFIDTQPQECDAPAVLLQRIPCIAFLFFPSHKRSCESNRETPTDQRTRGEMAEIFPPPPPPRSARVRLRCFFSFFPLLSFYFSLSPIARQEDEMKMYIAGPVRRTCPPVPPAAPARYLLHPPPLSPPPLATLAVVRRRVSRCG